MSWNETLSFLVVILGVVALAGAAVFTIRSNVAKVWREQAEGEKARADKADKEVLAQRDRAHGLISELAAERMKHDLTRVFKDMNDQHQEMLAALITASADSRGWAVEALEKMENRLSAQHEEIIRITALQAEILEKLADRIADRLDEKIAEKLEAQTQQIAEKIDEVKPEG